VSDSFFRREQGLLPLLTVASFSHIRPQFNFCGEPLQQVLLTGKNGRVHSLLSYAPFPNFSVAGTDFSSMKNNIFPPSGIRREFTRITINRYVDSPRKALAPFPVYAVTPVEISPSVHINFPWNARMKGFFPRVRSGVWNSLFFPPVVSKKPPPVFSLDFLHPTLTSSPSNPLSPSPPCPKHFLLVSIRESPKRLPVQRDQLRLSPPRCLLPGMNKRHSVFLFGKCQLLGRSAALLLFFPVGTIARLVLVTTDPPFPSPLHVQVIFFPPSTLIERVVEGRAHIFFHPRMKLDYSRPD